MKSGNRVEARRATAEAARAEEVRALRAEVEALKKSEALLRAVIDGIDQPISARDERGVYLLANSAACRLLGRPEAEVLGRSASDLFGPEVAEKILAGDREILAEGQGPTTREVAHEAGARRVFATTGAPLRDALGDVMGVAAISRDVTEMDRSEAELARQAEVLQAIFDHAPILIGITDPEDRILKVNREWHATLGWSEEEAPRLEIWSAMYPDPDLRREVLDFVREPRRRWSEFRARTRDGRTIDTAWSIVGMSDGTAIAFGLDMTERKQAEAGSRAGERRFRAVFEGALDAMVLADEAGRYLDANPSACALFGLPRDRLIGRSVSEFVSPDDGFEAAWGEFLGEAASRGVIRLTRDDGTMREVEFAASADIQPGVHLSVLRDVTERVRAVEALRDFQRGTVAILERITDGFFALDREWRFTYVNSQAEILLGRGRDQLIGRGLWSAFAEALGTAFETHYRRAMADLNPVAFEAFYAPLARWFRVHAYPSAEGLSVYFTDVSERREAEEALRRTERQFRDVLESSRDMIYRLDLKTHRYDYVSPSVRDLLGVTVGEIRAEGLPLLLGRVHPDDLVRHGDRVAALHAPDPASDFGPVIEYRVRVPGRGWRWLSDSGTLIRDEAGHPESVVGNVRDVTDQKASAERLRDLSRRLIGAQEEERRHIARELHDEIGQSLTAIKLNLRAVLRAPESPGAARRLEDALSLVDRTIGQVRDLSLDLRPSMLDDLGLVDALRSLVASFAERSGVAAEFVGDDIPGGRDTEVETACYRVAQEALTNVARHAGAARVRVELAITDRDLALSVSDDGRGFDVAAATERASGGASLGVLGMRERATLVGGSLIISSAPGRGAEVRATLPRKIPGAEPGDSDPRT